METKFKETKSSIAEILKLLISARATNPPGNVTLIPESTVGVAVK